MAQPHFAQKMRMIKGQALPLCFHFIGKLCHTVVEMRNGDAPLIVVQTGNNLAHDADRVDGNAAIHAGMQVDVGALDGEFLAQKPAQHGHDGGCFAFEQSCIADQRDVGPQFVCVVFHEGHKAGRSAFLFALKEKGDAAGQGTMHMNPGAAGFQKRHQLPFVVGRAATANDRTFGGVFNLRIKRIIVPQVQGIDRLHIIMAIEQQMRSVAVFVDVAHNHRMTGGFAFLRRHTQTRQIRHQPIGSRLAMLRVGGIGGNRRDAQQLFEALSGVRQISVDFGKNGIKGHGEAPDNCVLVPRYAGQADCPARFLSAS